MASVWLCVFVALLAFAAGGLGLYLGKRLPKQHASASRDMIGAMVGLVSLLLALALGTLIGSAYSFYSNRKSELETFASRAVQLDLALANFGPETMVARQKMKETLLTVHDQIWGTKGTATVADLSVMSPWSISGLWTNISPRSIRRRLRGSTRQPRIRPPALWSKPES